MRRNLKMSRLLSLPPEVRNFIMDFAYCYDKVYIHRSDGGKYSSSDKDVTGCTLAPVKTAQYVCRQLRAETYSLKLKQASIVAVEGVVFDKLRREKHSWLDYITRQLIIYGNVPNGLNFNPCEVFLHEHLIKFAFARPTVNIRVVVDELNWATSMETFIALGWTIRAALRGGACPLSSRAKFIKNWQRRVDWQNLNAKDLRFFPREPSFDESEFRAWFDRGKSTFKIGCLLPYYNKDMATVVKDMKSWWEEGL